MSEPVSIDNAKSEEFAPEMATLLDHLEEGVLIFDAKLRIVHRSSKCWLQFGYPKEAVRLEQLVTPEQYDGWKRAIELAQQESAFRTVLPDPNDGFVRLHACAQTDGRIVVSMRPAEPPVDRDELLGAFERVLAKYNIGLWKIHVPSGELWWSDKCYELLGIEPGPICTSAYMQDLSPEDRNRIGSQINMAMSQKGQYAPCFQIKHDGRIRHVQDRASVLQFGDDGEPVSFVGATIDRTKLVELENQCAHLTTQIDEAEALRQTGRLTGAVAHDLNNVITVILGNAELLRLQGLDPKHEESITNIYTAALHAGALSSRMLDFVRDSPLSMASIDAVRILRDSLPLLRALVGDSTDLVLDGLPATALIMGDRHRLEQALYNLVLNAGQAVGQDGRISLSLEVDQAFVKIQVADDGPGIDPAIRDQIFSPFFSTKETGVGLGLSSVRRVVDQHSGHIEVDSPPEGGTVFTIAIPRSFTQPEHFTHKVTQSATQDKKVWVVEDQLLVRVVTEQLLTQANYQVRSFGTPARLLQALDGGEGPPDLVLSDVMMPTMSGPELREQLIEQLPDIRFVFMTGYAADLLTPLAGALDSGSLLHKPFHRTELLRSITEALGGI